MDETTDLLKRAEALLADVAATRFTTLTDEALVCVTRQAEGVGRLLDAVRALTAAEIAERSRRELGEAGLARRLGHARPSHLIEQVTAASSAEAGRRIRLGEAVSPRAALDGHELPPLFPQVSAALAAGRIGAEAAAHIVRALGQAARRADPFDLAAAESALVVAAREGSADLIGDQAVAWRDHLDTDGVAPRYERQFADRRFTLGRERDDGMTPFSGLADPVNAGVLRAAMAAHRKKPSFTSQGEGRPGEMSMGEMCTGEMCTGEMCTGEMCTGEMCTGEMFTGEGGEGIGVEGAQEGDADSRTFEQRDFDIVMGLVTAGLRADDAFTAGGRASVVATVTLEDLKNGTGVGWLDDIRESIPVSAIDELVCDSGYEVAITGTNGSLTALTTKQDFFSRAQRRALAARDGGCVWPGCRAPASWTEAHHVIHREHDGRTDVSNGVLLCSAHHHFLHVSDHRMRMIRGRPHLLAPPRSDPEQRWRPVGKSRIESIRPQFHSHRDDPGPPKR